jgi:pimeloyl-ACP methyl ester carboxylesterase
MPKPTIVLVHGAWADGSSWNAVSAGLQSQGFTVLTPPNLLHGHVSMVSHPQAAIDAILAAVAAIDS